MRGRNTGRRNQSSQRQNFESSGPETKVRGNAQQVVEKYLQLARDATVADNRVMAENYFQHAEHYYRVQNANAANNENREGGRSQDGKPNDSRNGAGNGAASSANGNGADKQGEQPDVETAGEKENDVSQEAGDTDNDTDTQTPEAG